MRLGPGGIPFTREEALSVSRGARARADAALEAYRERAGMALLEANDEGGLIDQIAEHYEVDRGEVQLAQSPQASIDQTALYELLLDVMHYATANDLPWMQLLRGAAGDYERQHHAMRRILVYEADDQERPA